MFINVAFDLLLICMTLFACQLLKDHLSCRVVLQDPGFTLRRPFLTFGSCGRCPNGLSSSGPQLGSELIFSSCCSGIYITYALRCVNERVCMAQPISGSSPGTGVFQCGPKLTIPPPEALTDRPASLKPCRTPKLCSNFSAVW